MGSLGDVAARRWLIAAAVISAVSAISTAMQYDLLSGAVGVGLSDESAAANDLRQGAVAILGVVVLLVTYLQVGRFLYRTSQRLHAIPDDGAPMKYTPGWTIGWFFIPVASLVAPYYAIREMWQVSAPIDEGRRPTDTEVPGAFRLWWGLWVADNLLSAIVLQDPAGSDTIEGLMTGTLLGGVSDLLHIASALSAIWLVRNLAARTVAREVQTVFD